MTRSNHRGDARRLLARLALNGSAFVTVAAAAASGVELCSSPIGVSMTSPVASDDGGGGGGAEGAELLVATARAASARATASIARWARCVASLL